MPPLAALALLALGSGPPETCPCDAATALRYGDWLFARGEYYRAIGEYNRVIFLSGEGPLAERATLRMGSAYGRGGQAEKAELILRGLTEGGSTAEIRDEAMFEQGYARLLGKQWDLAASALARYSRLEPPSAGPGAAQASLLEGLARLRAGGQDDLAAEAFARASGDRALGTAARQLVDEARTLGTMPRKSPVVAGLLSAAVPGLGHLYVGEPEMAAAALLLNGVFLWATVESFRSHRPGAGAVFLLGESLWYGGAIFGAASDAMRLAREERLQRIDGLEARHQWSLEISAGSGGAGATLRVRLP